MKEFDKSGEDKKFMGIYYDNPREAGHKMR